MILIIGLGNPGQKFQKTRHNIGFRAVDEFSKKNDFPEFKFSKKINAEISEGFLNDEKVVVAKPQTFMNASGKSVKSLINFYKTPATPAAKTFFAVIHDDIALPLGKIKIIKNRGAAGHKGVQSIIVELGSKDFVRFRIGIKPKIYKPLKALDKFVLQKFSKDEEKTIKDIFERTVEAIEIVIKEGIEKAQQICNKKSGDKDRL